jgi:glycosyltransferase 2 family protein
VRRDNETRSPKSSRQSRFATLRRTVGIAIAVLAIALCAKALSGQWSNIRSSIAHANLGWLGVALATSALSMTGLALLWWRCLHVFNSRPRKRDAIAWYFGGELGKYVPGGIWPVLGRGELALRAGVARSMAYLTTLISYAAMCIAAGMVCGALAPFIAAGGNGLGWGWLMLALIPIGLGAVHPVVMGRVLALGRRITRGKLDPRPPPWSTMVGLIAWSIPTWLLVGAASSAITAALGYHQQPARVAFAAIAAWIIGFLVVPVPAGAGLREIVFVGVSGLATAPAVAVAAIARLMFVVVDGGGGLAGLYLARRAVSTASTVATSES